MLKFSLKCWKLVRPSNPFAGQNKTELFSEYATERVCLESWTLYVMTLHIESRSSLNLMQVCVQIVVWPCGVFVFYWWGCKQINMLWRRKLNSWLLKTKLVGNYCFRISCILLFYYYTQTPVIWHFIVRTPTKKIYFSALSHFGTIWKKILFIKKVV